MTKKRARIATCIQKVVRRLMKKNWKMELMTTARATPTRAVPSQKGICSSINVVEVGRLRGRIPSVSAQGNTGTSED